MIEAEPYEIQPREHEREKVARFLRDVSKNAALMDMIRGAITHCPPRYADGVEVRKYTAKPKNQTKQKE